MRAEEQFDSFYLKTRRALVHQAFALTGDLAASQRAVRDTYVAAWHHWRKVQLQEDPRDWVRPRAWAHAQRRHTARLWQRTRDLSPEDRAVLAALHKVPGPERRALLMVQLAGVPLDVAARELGVTQETLERQLQSATAKFAAALDVDSASVRQHLVQLGDAASRATLPRPAAVRREGRARRRTHTLVAAGLATFLAVGSGAFAHEPQGRSVGPSPSAGAPADGGADDAGTEDGAGDTPETEVPTATPTPASTLPSADDLLAPEDARQLDGSTRWQDRGIHDNTSGEGLNYVCQQERFADPEGLAALVRTLRSARKPARTLVQTVEISASEDEAAATYDTVLSWFASCPAGELQLERAFDVDQVGERARLLDLEGWGTPRSSYWVGIAEVGQVVTTSVSRSPAGAQPPRARAVGTLARAARMLCERAGRADCAGRPRVEAVPPPRSAEAPGALATVDLPPLPGVSQPWVGTTPTPASSSPASPSSCDQVRFGAAGAERGRSRTFVVPESRLPARFGLTETYGVFPSARQAAAFVRAARARLASCADRNLATDVLAPRTFEQGRLVGSTWRLRTELSESREVLYDVGLVRRGAAVAHLSFVPAGDVDLASGAFLALVVRAGQRLAELDQSPAP